MNINYTPSNYPQTFVNLGTQTASMKVDNLEVKSSSPCYSVSIEVWRTDKWEAFLKDEGIWHQVTDQKIIIGHLRADTIIWIGHWFCEWEAKQ